VLAVADDNKAAATAFMVAIDPLALLPRITHKVYHNVKFSSKGGKKGRPIIGLFRDIMPRTVESFLALCTNRSSGNAGFLPLLV
jgi:hypothetical protein